MDIFTTLQIILAEYQKIKALSVTKEELEETYITFQTEGVNKNE